MKYGISNPFQPDFRTPLTCQPKLLMDKIDLSCLFQHLEKSKIIQDIDIGVILSIIYEQEAAKTFFWPKKT